MSKKVIQQIWNNEILSPLKEECRSQEEPKNVFQKVHACLFEHPLLEEMSQTQREHVCGQITARLKELCLPPKKQEPLDPNNLPGPLYQLIQLFHSEVNSFRKVHRLIDMFEWAFKWHTVLVLSDLLKELDVSNEMKVLLSSGLRVPSLGLWVHFYRSALKEIKAPSLPWQEWDTLLSLENKNHIVAFRNGYAHGSTPSDEDCAKDIERLFPIFEELISSSYFSEVQLVYSIEGQAYRFVGPHQHPVDMDIPTGQVVAVSRHSHAEILFSLWPLCFASIDPKKDSYGRQFFYFNALKNKSIEQLNYEWGLHYREKKLWDSFHETLPLTDWKQISEPKLDLFREKIETLTEVFKGRHIEKKQLRDFCVDGAGNLMVWGPPGIGKSSLLAQVVKEIRIGVDGEGNRFTQDYPNIIPYFIRRRTESAQPEFFLRYMCQKLDQLYSLPKIPLGNSLGELSDAFLLRLQVISEQENPQKMVLFVDGLDEGIDFRVKILDYIPSSKSWLSVLCASRSVPYVEAWYTKRQKCSEMQIASLSKSDIRAFLYEVVNKYDLGLNEEYIQALQESSEGNPLYLKLLCDQIAAGSRVVGEMDNLPTKMSALYEEVLQRITEKGKNNDALTLLLLLTEAKSTLSPDTISTFLSASMTSTNAIIGDCMELLIETMPQKGVFGYQLFHESLRSYIRDTEVSECKKTRKNLAERCFHWKDLQGDALYYAHSFSAVHLKEENDDRLWELLTDESFRASQTEGNLYFENAYHSIVQGLEFYIDRNGNDDTDDARLSWMVLRARALSQTAFTELEDLFNWYEEDLSRLDKALRRIEILEGKNYRRACFQLLAISASAQRKKSLQNRDISIPHRILEELATRLENTSSFDDYLAQEVEVIISNVILFTWPNVDTGLLISCGFRASAINVPSEEIEILRQEDMLLEHLMLSYPKVDSTKENLGLCRLVSALTSSLNFQGALDVWNTIPNGISKEQTFLDVIEGLIQENEYEWALGEIENRSNPTLKVHSWLLVCKTVLNLDLEYNCIDILRRAQSTTKELVHENEMFEALCKIGVMFLQIGHGKESYLLADDISDPWRVSEYFAFLTREMCTKNNIERAQELYKSIKHDWYRSQVGMVFAQKYIDAKKYDEALVWIDSLSESCHQFDVQLSLARAWMEEDEKERGLEVVQKLPEDWIGRREVLVLFDEKPLPNQLEEWIDHCQQVSSRGERAKRLLYINTILMSWGRFEEAMELTNRIDVGIHADKVKRCTYEALCCAGKYGLALAYSKGIIGESQRAQALIHIIRHASEDLSDQIHTMLQGSFVSNTFYELFLTDYQAELSDTRNFRASLLYAPFLYKLGKASVYLFLATLYEQDKEEHAQAVIQCCPQLELHFLLPNIAYTYSTWKEWIDTIDDEDDNNDIRSWARRVEKGRMTEDEFTSRVEDLFD